MNNEHQKEKRLFAFGVCVVFIAVIVLVMHVDGAFGSRAEIELPLVAEEEAETPPDEENPPEAAVITDEPPHYITIKNMHFPADLTSLDLSDMRLTCEDIIPLQYMTNLVELNLWGDNRIIDISPLAGLTELKVLQLGGNPVVDISPLANLTELTELRMSDCNVSDLTPLTNLTKMRHLTLRDNQISDISPLENLKELTTLRLNGNPITDWSPVEHVREVDGRP
ncbi:MAG: leucine-rich repeat domain-containing protein [Oscillospiraceae bacterium]|nr:leucine-rich repeat domain-containing protein [Oscillospiraceae bacterium]